MKSVSIVLLIFSLLFSLKSQAENPKTFINKLSGGSFTERSAKIRDLTLKCVTDEEIYLPSLILAQNHSDPEIKRSIHQILHIHYQTSELGWSNIELGVELGVWINDENGKYLGYPRVLNQKNGFLAGDVITAVGGISIDNNAPLKSLAKQLSLLSVGDTVSISLIRARNPGVSARHPKEISTQIEATLFTYTGSTRNEPIRGFDEWLKRKATQYQNNTSP